MNTGMILKSLRWQLKRWDNFLKNLEQEYILSSNNAVGLSKAQTTSNYIYSAPPTAPLSQFETVSNKKAS